MYQHFQDYLFDLRAAYDGGGTEHTGRLALERLLKAVAADYAPAAKIQHEPNRQQDKGAPDFKVTRSGLILGYVETKPIGGNLDKVLKSGQIKRYRELSENILLTDYLDFIWISRNSVQRGLLCHSTDLENPKLRLREDRAEAVAKLLQGFFSTAPERIGRSEQLALALAVRSKLLREYLSEELVRQEKAKRGGRLYGLFEIFRDQVFHDLKLAEFADAFAQMLAYGLFLARFNSASENITLHNAREYVPGSFRLIRELVNFLSDLENPGYRDVRWVVEEVLSIVNALDLAAIHEDLSFRHRKVRRGARAKSEEEARLFERDPFVYFYEDYLSRHNPDERERRGVYYTPPPVVNFIVRAIDDILKDPEIFGIRDGLADHQQVTVLDFACGTGTFLVEVFERIFETIGGPEAGKAGLVVREHILKNIYGFEYLVAPYTIAHLKLSQYLADRGHALDGEERLQIFLTNTLEPIEPQRNLLLPELSNEVEAAQEVKDKPILVITGNPPYYGHSRNKGPVASASIKAYRLVDGQPLGEKNPKWLQDDYVKFIRFAQMKMDGFTYQYKAPDGKLIEHSLKGTENGIVGVITNHSYLRNPTFRGMRQSLMKTFDQIFILDLHGSTKPKETPPDGHIDENVFEIQKGVAIALFVKRPGVTRGVWYGEIWGKRIAKYKTLASRSLNEQTWSELIPVAPSYLFIPHDRKLWTEYEQGWSIPTIFPVNVLGFQTHRDHFAIGWSREQMEERVADLRNERLSDDELREKYVLRDSQDWQTRGAREALSKLDLDKIIECAYRPFDNRWCWFGAEITDRPRRELLDHVAWKDNLQILVSRQIGTSDWRHIAISDTVAESCVVSNETKAQNYNFPLYRYHPDKDENLHPDFRTYIDKHFDNSFTPEEILGYIYAILHTPTYRARYAEFLRMDFPRVPFPESASEFEGLSQFGWQLVQAHLLRDVPPRNLGRYHGKGDHIVDKPRYAPLERAVWINAAQYFALVPQEVWEFRIGGYQVLDKYLKSRKGRTLNLDEINHVAKVADCLAFTIEQMQRIDDAYLAAFPDRG